MHLKEIQGLRAVAALLVAVYHIWFHRVSGGVDAFFVIAGYLLFTSLFRKGDFAPAAIRRYYQRTMARIVPGVAAVVAGTCALFYALEVDSIWRAQILDAAASLGFVMNWWLAQTGRDYLDIGAPPSPFQQMWALSLQVQLYFALPLVAWAVHAVVTRLRLGERWVFGILAALAVVSFAYAQSMVFIDQQRAYFDSVARGWEFLLGGLLALRIERLRLSARAAKALGLVALFVFCTFAAAIPAADLFPGAVALIPVLATAAIIVAARNGGEIRPLTAPAMQRLGDLSFAFYLWHWPLYVAVWIRTGDADVGLLPGLGVIVLAGLLAQATTAWLEAPFRRSRWANGRFAAAALACALVLAPAGLAVGAWGAAYLDARREANEAMARFKAGQDVAGVLPPTVVLRADVAKGYYGDCHQVGTAEAAKRCVYGAKDGDRTVALVGGSHSLQWLPALEVLAERESSLRILALTKASCPFTFPDPSFELAHAPSCAEWTRRVIESLLAEPPAMVLTVGTRMTKIGEVVPEGFAAAWAPLLEAGIPVVALRDTPRPGFDAGLCVDRSPDLSACAVERDAVLRPTPFGPGEVPEGVRLIDLSDLFCDDRICPPVRGDLIVYRDASHITATYARANAHRLAEALGQ
ncbi:acyltransferase family protein [Albimonas pacifica]|uniref:Peptidoglycan/LPS O-acetylase OafA/YrhL, contains acyltransferase and SGNH-hydrolase domains n=1 Tax=Albimonas pacifica TaxID=1114924 RepID=A0A1I3K8A1_9RHOB|nr:acyltransferase family protein [Albimonas pacifica]SFI68722.1 Peptidoglycan/LPS O-acetylase OafA/YrhL, contains acyltransferase and SGNH-hydrolase domains [Albimonas pacifica]